MRAIAEGQAMRSMTPSAAPGRLVVRAPAKINLTLDVLGRRPDGYHALRSVMQTLELHDTLELRPAPAIRFACDVPALAGEDNLVPRAARLLRTATGYAGGVDVTLHKRIPVNAGLGGGSSDAAATLLALNRLWGLALTPERLAELGAALGSDVPFFFYAPLALVSGRGEVVEALPPAPPAFVVLLQPPCGLSTAQVFAALPPTRYGCSRRSRPAWRPSSGRSPTACRRRSPPCIQRWPPPWSSCARPVRPRPC
jgi:4-diphosphocytidyl-2-C-methyl-D-erythritol kinase